MARRTMIKGSVIIGGPVQRGHQTTRGLTRQRPRSSVGLVVLAAGKKGWVEG